MSKPNLMTYAKEIRKEGEAWKDAVIRASSILSGENTETSTEKKADNETPEPTPEENTEGSGLIRKAGESIADFLKRKRNS